MNTMEIKKSIRLTEKLKDSVREACEDGFYKVWMEEVSKLRDQGLTERQCDILYAETLRDVGNNLRDEITQFDACEEASKHIEEIREEENL